MKHLRRYNESIDPDIRQDILDICLDIVDVGFKISIVENKINKNNYIYIEHERSFSPYPYKKNIFKIDNNFKEVLLRLRDFLGDRYVNCSLLGNDSFGISTEKLIELTEDIDLEDVNKLDILDIVIYFK